jgi:DNA ligase-associated metallophosphoesterase
VSGHDAEFSARDAEANADASSGVGLPMAESAPAAAGAEAPPDATVLSSAEGIEPVPAVPTPSQAQPQQTASTEIYVAGVRLVADCEGALYWPDEGALIVADLHLEKGSSYATRGVLLPPYDTAATLGRLAELIGRYAPTAVIALGDSFHDGDGPMRLGDADRAALLALQRGRDWLWVAGNHDPDPSEHVAGSFAATLAIGPLLFRHAPQAGAASGEVAGHLHPVARVSGRGRTVRRRCFVSDRKRVILPAFGAYAGGLNVRDRAFAEIFGNLAFTAHMLGKARIYAFAATHCLAD